jgi:hypothetical protein
MNLLNYKLQLTPPHKLVPELCQQLCIPPDWQLEFENALTAIHRRKLKAFSLRFCSNQFVSTFELDLTGFHIQCTDVRALGILASSFLVLDIRPNIFNTIPKILERWNLNPEGKLYCWAPSQRQIST